MPENYDHAKAEAGHLIHEADVDSVSNVCFERVLALLPGSLPLLILTLRIFII